MNNNRENYLLVYPKDLNTEVNRNIDSLGFVDSQINLDTSDISELKKRYSDLNDKIYDLDREINSIYHTNSSEINNLSFTKRKYINALNFKKFMLKGKEYFYMCFYSNEKNYIDISLKIKKYKDVYLKLMETNFVNVKIKENKNKTKEDNKVRKSRWQMNNIFSFTQKMWKKR